MVQLNSFIFLGGVKAVNQILVQILKLDQDHFNADSGVACCLCESKQTHRNIYIYFFFFYRRYVILAELKVRMSAQECRQSVNSSSIYGLVCLYCVLWEYIAVSPLKRVTQWSHRNTNCYIAVQDFGFLPCINLSNYTNNTYNRLCLRERGGRINTTADLLMTQDVIAKTVHTVSYVPAIIFHVYSRVFPGSG